MSIQPTKEINDFYKKVDPWGYEENEHDRNRKGILLGELEKFDKPQRTLDIGCGHGFITRELPGAEVIGVDISSKAIEQAKKLSKNPRCTYLTADLFELIEKINSNKKFDLIIITGVVYPQYIGHANNLVYQIVDKLLASGGTLISVHIDEWYKARFPYVLTKFITYKYREYQHVMEIYKKI